MDDKDLTLAESIRSRISDAQEGAERKDQKQRTRGSESSKRVVINDVYEILDEVVASDSISKTYRARHTVVERGVNIRLLNAELVSDEEAVQRFMEQGRDLARGTASSPHGNICDLGKTPEGICFLVLSPPVGQQAQSGSAADKSADPLTLADAIRRKIVEARDSE